MTAGEDGVLRVDLGALRAFITTVETELEAAIAARGTGLEARFFPAGRDAEHRHFGRSPHHAAAEAIGRAQHANAAAHLDRLGQARDGLAIARQVAQRLLDKYRDLDEQQEIGAAAVTDALARIRSTRTEAGGE